MTTQWTPKLEKLIRQYGNATERQAKMGLDAKISPEEAVLRLAFHDAISVQPLVAKICMEAAGGNTQKTSRTELHGEWLSLPNRTAAMPPKKSKEPSLSSKRRNRQQEPLPAIAMLNSLALSASKASSFKKLP